MNAFTSKRGAAGFLSVALSFSLFLVGCGGSSDSDRGDAVYLDGVDDGFADDSEYFLGYDESFMTVGAGPIMYSGDQIPFSDELTYQAGFWDGQFEAYNDGYFVAYRFAFIVGFSEGYDNAFASDFLAFLASDLHSEYLHGGFSDGYNDGFSEGRIFGAFDYEAFLTFNWLDAFLDWESGTDLYFVEVDKGTGDSGPVTLYEWGIDPHTIGVLTRDGGGLVDAARRMRKDKNASTAVTKVDPFTVDATRPFSTAQESDLSVSPTTTSRTNRDLTLTTTWLDRINAYLNSSSLTKSAPVDRSEMSRP